MAGDHQQHRCEMGARAERVLPLQGREAPREGRAPGAGGLLGGMGLGEGTCVGKGAAWPLHHGGQGRQEYGSPAARGVPVRVLEMGLEAGAVTCWNRAWGSVSPWL